MSKLGYVLDELVKLTLSEGEKVELDFPSTFPRLFQLIDDLTRTFSLYSSQLAFMSN